MFGDYIVFSCNSFVNVFIAKRVNLNSEYIFYRLGKTVDGDFLSSDDVELVQTIGGYVAVALDNAQLYSSLEQKALQVARLKDFSENIVESLNVGVLAVDLEGTIDSWNSRMEQLIGVSRTSGRTAARYDFAAGVAARDRGPRWPNKSQAFTSIA